MISMIDADGQEPAAEDQPENSTAERRSPTMSGRNDGPGMWTPGGGADRGRPPAGSTAVAVWS